jgi:hypothetical protein
MLPRRSLASKRRHLTIGTAVLLGALSLMLLGTMSFVYLSLPTGWYAALPAHFRVSMTLGIFFSLVVGFGLMALVFYSNHNGYDDPPNFTHS